MSEYSNLSFQEKTYVHLIGCAENFDFDWSHT
jgi:hypothetical protein